MKTDPKQSNRRQLPAALVVLLLVVIGAALFVGTYLLSFFLLIELLDEVPLWLATPILLFDVLWVVLIRFRSISRRAKVISTLLVLTVSAAVLFTMLCVWTIPV